MHLHLGAFGVAILPQFTKTIDPIPAIRAPMTHCAARRVKKRALALSDTRCLTYQLPSRNLPLNVNAPPTTRMT